MGCNVSGTPPRACSLGNTFCVLSRKGEEIKSVKEESKEDEEDNTHSADAVTFINEKWTYIPRKSLMRLDKTMDTTDF